LGFFIFTKAVYYVSIKINNLGGGMATSSVILDLLDSLQKDYLHSVGAESTKKTKPVRFYGQLIRKCDLLTRSVKTSKDRQVALARLEELKKSVNVNEVVSKTIQECIKKLAVKP